MASAYVWDGVRWIPTWMLRTDPNCKDQDIKNHPSILKERRMYEEREHLEPSNQTEIIA